MDVASAVVAGLIATLVMTALMYLAKAMGMPMDMPRMLGLMFAGPGRTGLVYTLGLIVHFMMGAIFGLLYAWLFGLFGVPAGWLWGGIFGLGHGIVAGIFMGMMPAMHPRMGPNKPLPAPGFFAKNMSPMAPVGIVMLHIIFGIVLGALYVPA